MEIQMFNWLNYIIKRSQVDEGFVFDQQAGRRFWGSQGSGILFVRNHPQFGLQILAVLRSSAVEEPETWGTSGGAVRPGEDPFQSALRETIEEIGSIPSYRKVSEYIWQSGGNFKYTTYILEATDLNWEPKNFNWEVDDAKWVSLDDASSMNLHFGLESLLNAKKQELENKMQQNQQLIGYKIVGWDGKRAFSLYQTNKTVNITIGSIDKNIYLGTTRQFVLDYYSGGTDYQDLLLTYQFRPEDVIKGDPDDKGPGGGEIIVQQAKLIKVENV